jgi:hypothetical protein
VGSSAIRASLSTGGLLDEPDIAAVRGEAENAYGVIGHGTGMGTFGGGVLARLDSENITNRKAALQAQVFGTGPSWAILATNQSSGDSIGIQASVTNPSGVVALFRKGTVAADPRDPATIAAFEDDDNAYVLLRTPADHERGWVFSSGTTHHGGVYYTDAAGMSLRTGGNSTRMRIDSGGNVGIGTTAPASRLHVNGQLHLQGTSQDISVQSGEVLQVGHFDGTTFTERMRVDTGGNVGIGTSTPGAPLDVHVGAGQTLQFRRDSALVPGINVNTTGGNAGIMRLRNTLELWPSDDLTRASKLDLRNTANATTIVLNGGTGALSAASKAFRIDHPLDPQNKELWHSCVESDEMKNIYDGVVTTDGAGFATVTLPEWFGALNKDFRYQLTIIDEGGHLPDAVFARVVRRVENNTFTVKTSLPNVEVSWQVTGVRKDPYAERHRLPVEVEKSSEDKGRYLHPEAFGAGGH